MRGKAGSSWSEAPLPHARCVWKLGALLRLALGLVSPTHPEMPFSTPGAHYPDFLLITHCSRGPSTSHPQLWLLLFCCACKLILLGAAPTCRPLGYSSPSLGQPPSTPGCPQSLLPSQSWVLPPTSPCPCRPLASLWP